METAPKTQRPPCQIDRPTFHAHSTQVVLQRQDPDLLFGTTGCNRWRPLIGMTARPSAEVCALPLPPRARAPSSRPTLDRSRHHRSRHGPPRHPSHFRSAQAISCVMISRSGVSTFVHTRFHSSPCRSVCPRGVEISSVLVNALPPADWCVAPGSSVVVRAAGLRQASNRNGLRV